MVQLPAVPQEAEKSGGILWEMSCRTRLCVRRCAIQRLRILVRGLLFAAAEETT